VEPEIRTGTRHARRLGLAAVLVCLTMVVPNASSASAAGSSPPIAAPAHIGPYALQSANKTLTGDPLGKKIIAHLRLVNQHSTRDVSKAYGGAPAVVESYASADLLTMFSLIAVRASSPGLIVLYEDPKYLQLVRAPTELLTFGATSCQVQNDATPIGKKPTADSVHVFQCQRTGPHLTIRLAQFASDTLGSRPSAAAAVVDQAWQILSKG
jgi:hypothetical protein